MDYNTDRLSNLTSSLARKLQFFDESTTELQSSLLSNINYDGDNNEKTKKLKTRVGIFKNMGGYSTWEYFGPEFHVRIF